MQRPRGMSLIEVMMAGALLAIGASATFSAWATVTGIMEHQRRQTDATGLARSQLERLLSLPSGHSRLDAGSHPIGTFDVFGTVDPAGYRVTHEIASNRPGPGFIEVTVVVSWDERMGERRTRLTSFRER